MRNFIIISLVAMLCGCNVYHRVIDVQAVDMPDRDELFFVVDTIKLSNPIIIDYPGDLPRLIIDSCQLSNINGKDFEYIFNNSINYIYTGNYFYDYPYRSKLPIEQYGTYQFVDDLKLKAQEVGNHTDIRLFSFVEVPDSFLLVLMNVAYFNKKYNGIDGSVYISVNNPSNMYVKVAYPIHTSKQ